MRFFEAAALAVVLASGSASAFAQDATPIDNLKFWSLDDYEKSGKTIGAFHQAPALEAAVAAKTLPPLEQRLPQREDIQVVQPRDSIGTYGGTISYNASNPISFSNIGYSAWDVHLSTVDSNWANIVPDLARSIDIAPDAKSATVRLRRGLKWSDGAPLTADDIMFWAEDIAGNPSIPPMTGATAVSTKTTHVTKVDDVTVTFTFDNPNPGFLISAARNDGAGFPIAPRHYLSKWHIKYNKDADALAKSEGYASWVDDFVARLNGQVSDLQVKTGLPVAKPWVLVRIDQFGNQFFERNPYFWKVDTAGNQLPYLDGQVRMLISDPEVVKLNVQAGKLDYADKFAIGDLPVLKAGEKGGNYTTMLFPADQGAIRKYSFNITTKDPGLRDLFNNVHFREAMSLAVNRPEINDTIYFGLGVPRQWGVSSKSAFSEPWEADYFAAYDPAKANSLLDSIGLKKGANGLRTRPDGQPLKIILTDAIGSVPLSELMAEYWKKVGVDTQINTTTREAFAQALSTNDIQAAVWFADVVSEKDMYARPIWFRPPYGLDLNPVGGGLAWRQWWLSGGTQGSAPPEEYRKVMELADKFQASRFGSPEYYQLGKQIVADTVRSMLHIGTVGEVPLIYTRSNKLKNFPGDKTIYIDHLNGAHSEQWFLQR